MDLAAVRALLRAERKKRRMSLDDLAKTSGITRSAIHAVERDATGHPRFETIAALIEGMEGLTLSEFFSKIERQTKTDATKNEAVNPGVRSGTELVTAATGAPPHGANRVDPSLGGAVAVDALLDISNRIIDALQQLGVAAVAPRETRDVATPRSGRAPGARGHR